MATNTHINAASAATKGDDMKLSKRERTILDLAMKGLYTDGGHHKQFILEEIIATLTEASVEDVRRVIAPYEHGTL